MLLKKDPKSWSTVSDVKMSRKWNWVSKCFKDTLRRIKKRYETDCREYGREPTIPVEKSVDDAKKEADQMFFDVLGRKDRADATRNALNVMNRFNSQTKDHLIIYRPEPV